MSNYKRLLIVLLIGGLGLGAAQLPTQVWADEPQPVPITIQADRLVTSGSENAAEFSGNVEARQDTTVIRAEALKIFYQAGAIGTGDQQPALQEAIERIQATGNVSISLDDRLATADVAEYVLRNGVITLTGSPARISSGPNVIAGQTIILYTETQEIRVERGSEQRVEAVLYSTQALPAMGPEP